VTERQASEEAKYESKALQLHSEVLISMAEGVTSVDSHGIIRLTNHVFDAKFGHERGELLGQPVSILDFGGKKTYRLVDTIRNRRKDGTEFITRAWVTLR
jgi:PAS domain S-box-containing protein